MVKLIRYLEMNLDKKVHIFNGTNPDNETLAKNP